MKNKLKLLLVDDRPGQRWLDLQLGDFSVPGLDEYFEYYWINKPEDAKLFIDLYSHISSSDQLRQLRLPPDILIFDYAMTQSDDTFILNAESSTNPIPLLKKFLGKDIVDRILKETNEHEPFSMATYSPGGDRFGCFIGGIFARTFFDHPCGSIASTAHADKSELNDEVKFFEWMNQGFMHGMLNDSMKRKLDSPVETVKLAVIELRKRLEELINTKVVELSIESILLLQGKEFTKEDSVRILSKRCIDREYCLGGIFFDQLNSEHEFKTVVSKWFEEKIFIGDYDFSNGSGDFAKGYSLALQYFNFYNPTNTEEEDGSDLNPTPQEKLMSESENRTRIIRLTHSRTLSGRMLSELKSLCAYFDISINELKPPNGKSVELIKYSSDTEKDPRTMYKPPIWDLCKTEPEVGRWATLIMCVFVEVQSPKSAWDNSDNGEDIYDPEVQKMQIQRYLNPLPKIIGASSVFSTAMNGFSTPLKFLFLNQRITVMEGKILRQLAWQKGLKQNDFPAWLENTNAPSPKRANVGGKIILQQPIKT